MTVKQAIEETDQLLPNHYSTDQKLLWLSELDGRVQTEIMLADVADVFGYNVEQYDANMLVLPPHDAMYLDWLMYKAAEYYAEIDRAQYHRAEFERKYNRYAAWYMNQYRPADRKRKEQKRWITTA